MGLTVLVHVHLCIHVVFSCISLQVLHKGLSSENLMIGSEFYLKLTGMYTDNSSMHKEPAMRQLKRTASVSLVNRDQIGNLKMSPVCVHKPPTLPRGKLLIMSLFGTHAWIIIYGS